MGNSPLVSFTKLSPNHSGKRTHTIDRITPHAVVGQLSVERICDCFKDRSRQASCNYAIGADGRIGLCVDEQNRSWCSSSRDNDQRAVTIEGASDLTGPYTMKPVLLTVHRWFARKSCPGNWLFGKLGDLAQEVNSRLRE